MSQHLAREDKDTVWVKKLGIDNMGRVRFQKQVRKLQQVQGTLLLRLVLHQNYGKVAIATTGVYAQVEKHGQFAPQ